MRARSFMTCVPAIGNEWKYKQSFKYMLLRVHFIGFSVSWSKDLVLSDNLEVIIIVSCKNFLLRNEILKRKKIGNTIK